MKKRAVKIVFALLCAATSLSGISAQADDAATTPTIKLLSAAKVEVGKITTDQIQHINYKFGNTGKVPVEISQVTATCICIENIREKIVLQPGAEEEVSLTFDPQSVKGTFTRGAWVHTTDPKNPRIQILLSGEVVPFFQGLPERTLIFRSTRPGVTWTNSLKLTAANEKLLLGTPVVSNAVNLALSASVTAAESEKGVFNLNIQATPQSNGACRAYIHLPVTGGIKPVEIVLPVMARTGSQLVVSPDAFIIHPTERPLMRSFLMRANVKEVDPHKVSLKPEIDGVTFEVLGGGTKRRAAFMLRITATPEAVNKLLDEKGAELTVEYPEHDPATISFKVDGEE